MTCDEYYTHDRASKYNAFIVAVVGDVHTWYMQQRRSEQRNYRRRRPDDATSSSSTPDHPLLLRPWLLTMYVIMAALSQNYTL